MDGFEIQKRASYDAAEENVVTREYRDEIDQEAAT